MVKVTFTRNFVGYGVSGRIGDEIDVSAATADKLSGVTKRKPVKKTKKADEPEEG